MTRGPENARFRGRLIICVGPVNPNGVTRTPERADVDYGDGETERPADYPTLGDKADKAFEVARRTLEAYDDPAVVWTGDRDSTLTLYLVRAVADRHGYDRPPAVFLDHFQHFPDVVAFVERWADEWGIDLRVARNEDVAADAAEPGDEVRVEDLNEANRRRVRDALKYDGETFPFLLRGSRVGSSAQAVGTRSRAVSGRVVRTASRPPTYTRSTVGVGSGSTTSTSARAPFRRQPRS